VTVPARRLPDDAAAAVTALDLVVGVASYAVRATDRTVRVLHLTPVVAAGARPFLRAGRAWRGRVVREVDAVLPILTELAVRRYLDLDKLVATVDLDAVAERIDVDAVVARVDIDAIAARIDVESVLDRMDLTQTVLDRVDLKAVVERVLTQLDLAALVEEVLDEIDLPDIIRESTGTMASDTVRSVRLQGVNADETISRVVGRLLMRRPRPAASDGTP
jgi:hypothetical protein